MFPGASSEFLQIEEQTSTIVPELMFTTRTTLIRRAAATERENRRRGRRRRRKCRVCFELFSQAPLLESAEQSGDASGREGALS